MSQCVQYPDPWNWYTKTEASVISYTCVSQVKMSTEHMRHSQEEVHSSYRCATYN